MKIETLDDWNLILGGCGCCLMPSCPTPTQECESINATAYINYAEKNAGPPLVHYKITRDDYSGGGFYQLEYDPIYRLSMGGSFVEPGTIIVTTANPLTGSITTTNSVVVDPATAQSAAEARMLTELDWATMTTFSQCTSSRDDKEVTFSSDTMTSLRWSRFRWVIPDDFEGNYFKITWDVIEEPDGWDDSPPTASRSFVLTDQTWEWTGPGDPDDEDSWKSGWYQLDPPSVDGIRRVVNIRFECYKSAKMGVAPQLTGDAVELPDP